MNALDIPKASQDIQNEVQDFSLKKQQNSGSGANSKSGNKLDDTLTKLMKRKNCVSIMCLFAKSFYVVYCVLKPLIFSKRFSVNIYWKI